MGQLYLQQGITSIYPSSGTVLYTDGLGGTFWSTAGGGGGGGGSGDVTSLQLVSTVVGLGTARYASTTFVTAQLSSFSTSLGSVGAGNLTTSNLASTVVGLGTAGYISSLTNLVSTPFLNTTLASTLSGMTLQQSISSLTVNQLTIGTGTGWLQLAPIQSPIVSSIQQNTQSNYTNNLFLGTVSAATAAKFYGLTGSYANTALAEISTGTGTQEFLVFKGSSVSDRIRMQTTGNFIVETGVSARTWSETTVTTLSNATPALIVNTNSNVGIQTATPATALDVVGTIRAPILSTITIYAGSYSMGVFFA